MSLNESQLSELCHALGWQGGTYHQVLARVRQLAESPRPAVLSDAEFLSLVRTVVYEAGKRRPNWDAHDICTEIFDCACDVTKSKSRRKTEPSA
jgi:hypothetical protein